MLINECKALVTGGSKGIGFAIAAALKSGEAQVAVTGRDQKALDEAAKQIDAVTIVSDVRKPGDCKKAVKTAKEKLGGLNVLINNAGVGYHVPLDNIEPERFHDVWATNVLGAAIMAQEAIKIFKEQQYGTIVNIGSSSGVRGYENGSPYVASKFALRGMSECWRAELRKFNIRVILINPSEVQTGMGSKITPAHPNPKKLLAEDIAHAVILCLTMNDRGFIPEIPIWATNPW